MNGIAKKYVAEDKTNKTKKKYMIVPKIIYVEKVQALWKFGISENQYKDNND